MTLTLRCIRRGLVAATLLVPSVTTAQSAAWMRSGLSPDRRTTLLLGAMTLAEKMQQLVGAPGVIAEIPSCYGARHVPAITGCAFRPFASRTDPWAWGK